MTAWSLRFWQANFARGKENEMDKLISANSIIQKLIPILNENGDMYFVGRIIGMIDSEPVAFDKEKVIEGLEEWKKYTISWAEKYKRLGNLKKAREREIAATAYSEAIEEIEKGGIEEE